jgi:hypothetical protein
MSAAGGNRAANTMATRWVSLIFVSSWNNWRARSCSWCRWFFSSIFAIVFCYSEVGGIGELNSLRSLSGTISAARLATASSVISVKNSTCGLFLPLVLFLAFWVEAAFTSVEGAAFLVPAFLLTAEDV